ncbi:unnamed protein product [Caenorhabditis angaria]|uniref:Exonuclease domain-containing protein n=1 Tax=Caenorhabditis angaria TaxID=860376 RepID=A0A9P1N1Z3_9PELO|nr:unnamed protein product [Caenorhabditis angaria]
MTTSTTTAKGNDWRYLLSLSINHQTENPISCLKFDPHEELIWCASSTGKVASFSASNHFNRYSAFVSTRIGAVNALDITEEVVFSLSDDCLRGTSRQGIPISKYTSLSMTKMSAICRLPNTSMYIMGGEQSKLLQFDFSKEKEIRTFDMAENDAVLIRYNGANIFTADTSGFVNVRNTKTLETIQRIACHGDHISDFDVQGSKLITCGFSQRLKSSHGDPFVKIFDLRMYKAMAPIPLAFAPRFARFMPSYCEKLVVVSQNGGVRISELNSNGVGTSIIVDMNGLSSFDFSTSKQFMCFGDFGGGLSVYADRDEAVINEDSYDTIFAFPPVGPPVSFNIEETTTPYATVPMPFPEDDSLLSDWPSELTQPMYRLLKPTPEHTDKKVMHYVTQVKNPRNNTKLRLHNVCPYILENDLEAVKTIEEDLQILTTEKVRVAKFYKKCPQLVIPMRRRVEEETETYNYNQTNHVLIASTYHMNILTNPIVHALYHNISIRNFFNSHICISDSCLPCQLRFLFSMISDPSCNLASSSNLIRTLVANGFVTFKHDVIKSTKLAIDLFFNGISEISEDIEKHCMKTEMVLNFRCIRCGALQQTSPKNEYKITIPYSSDQKSPSFCQIIEKSLHLGINCGLTSEEKECEECRATTKMESKRKIQKLADVLIIDTNSTNPVFHEFWQRQLASFERKPTIRFEKNNEENNRDENEKEKEKEKKQCRFGEDCRNKKTCKFQHGKIDWERESSNLLEEGDLEGWKHYIPAKFAASVNDGIVRLNDISDCEHYDEPNQQIYELVAIVAVIGTGEYPVKWTHSITILKDNQEKIAPWSLINEQLVCHLHQNEALHFDPRWKLPILLEYRKITKELLEETEIRHEIPENLFFSDDNLASNSMKSSELIDLPKKGELIGIDAEFIKIKCSKLDNERRGVLSRAVGRVSCVDSTGTKIILDDHVQVIDSNEVSDYLTPFSGIKSDDLDAQKSTKYLTTLKRVYLKILILVQRGCIFVGHALNNDFSVLNIHVPENQVIDTVNLLRLDSKRLLSLQFLALQLLGDKIQEDCHDSVVDAQYALKIYMKYLELKEMGLLNAEMRRIYDIVPNGGGASPMKSVSPANSMPDGKCI